MLYDQKEEFGWDSSMHEQSCDIALENNSNTKWCGPKHRSKINLTTSNCWCRRVYENEMKNNKTIWYYEMKGKLGGVAPKKYFTFISNKGNGQSSVLFQPSNLSTSTKTLPTSQKTNIQSCC